MCHPLLFFRGVGFGVGVAFGFAKIVGAVGVGVGLPTLIGPTGALGGVGFGGGVAVGLGFPSVLWGGIAKQALYTLVQVM